MKLLLDILQGAGLGTAAGLRPFLPGLVAGGLAAGDLGLDFDGTSWSFLEAPWWLVLLAVLLVVFLLARRFAPDERIDDAALVIGVVVGAFLAAGSLDDRHDTWWYGLIIGAAFALLSAVVVRSLFARVRTRFRASDDEAAAAALPFYAELAGLVVAGLSILFPPLALVAIVFLAALLVTGRRRSGQKYAGLRILR